MHHFYWAAKNFVASAPSGPCGDADVGFTNIGFFLITRTFLPQVHFY